MGGTLNRHWLWRCHGIGAGQTSSVHPAHMQTENVNQVTARIVREDVKRTNLDPARNAPLGLNRRFPVSAHLNGCSDLASFLFRAFFVLDLPARALGKHDSDSAREVHRQFQWQILSTSQAIWATTRGSPHTRNGNAGVHVHAAQNCTSTATSSLPVSQVRLSNRCGKPRDRSQFRLSAASLRVSAVERVSPAFCPKDPIRMAPGCGEAFV